MAVSKKQVRIRFEIWLAPTDVTFAQNHLVSSGQSVKNYIESLFMMKVSSRRAKTKALFG